MGYRKWVVLCSLTGLFFFNTAAFTATGGSTGGGNVVSCTDPLTGLKTHRLLDYYEAETLMPELLPDLSGGKTELEKVDFVLSRLEKHDAKRAQKYRVIAHDFFKNTQFILNKVLPDINDHGYVPKESHCVIEQLAVQNISPFPQAKKYVIRDEFWKKLSVEDRAGLILHEVIYEEAMAMGQKTSRNSRYFNALVSSKKLETMSAVDYADRLDRVGFTDGGSKPVDPSPWAFSATRMTAHPGVPFSASLSEFIINGTGHTFSFFKVSGVSWLTLSADGNLTGTPTRFEIGENVIQVSVRTLDRGEIFELKVSVQEPRDSMLAIVGMPFSEDLLRWAPNGPLVKSIRKGVGPAWLSVTGDHLVGTPRVSDVGPFVVQIDYTYDAVTSVEEILPDGTRRSRLVPEERTERLALNGTVGTQPPLGDVVPPDALEQIVKLRVGVAGCVGTLIGPRVIVTAAHCASTGSIGEFTFEGMKYRATFTQIPMYVTQDHDVALGLINQEVQSLPPLSIEGSARVGMQLHVASVRADPANKRLSEVDVSGLGKHRIAVVHKSGGQIIYPGDSGAAGMIYKNDGVIGVVSAMGVDSSGKFTGPTHLARLDSVEARDFLKHFATKNNVDICGVNRICQP